jgi:hypothetical protein
MRGMSADKDDPRVARGKALADALEERKKTGLTMRKLTRFASLTDPTWYAAIKGEASEDSYDAFEQAIQEWDANPTDRVEERRRARSASSTKAIPFTIEMKGVFGVESVTFSGPPDDTEAVQQAAVEFVRKIREATGKSD